MRTLRTTLLLLVLAIPLASCKTTDTAVISACEQWRPVSWSQKDTRETIADVKGNNARRAAWCAK